MKQILLLIIFLVLHSILYSQFINWVWANGEAKSLNSNGFGNAITVTNANIIYCVGQFNSQVISFSPVLLANDDIEYQNEDVFLVCYTTSGEVLWARSMGGNGDDVGKSIASDKEGNIYIAGGFTSTKIGFGKDTLYNSGQEGTNDAFVAKYTGKGEEVWAKKIGSSHDDQANCIAVDKDDNVYVTGHFYSGKLIFQKGDTLKNSDPSGSSPDIFLIKYSKDGNFIFCKSINGSKYDFGYAITTDSHNNVYVTGGTFSSEVHLDSIVITTSPTEAEDERLRQTTKPKYMWVDEKGEEHDTTGMKYGKDKLKRILAVYPPNAKTFEKIFIAKYSETGKLLWAESMGGSNDEEGSALTTDANDNVYLTGRFQSTSMTMETTTMENKGSNDIFISKYNSDGKTLWAKSVGGMADDRGNTVATDAIGNVYIAGWFASAKAIFGKCTQINSGGKSYTDMFIAKYDALGNALWAENAKGSYSEWCNGMAIDKGGNIFLTGGFDSSEMNFGTIKLMNGKKKSFFIAKMIEK